LLSQFVGWIDGFRCCVVVEKVKIATLFQKELL
jgi:hypothetical protein